MLMQTLFIPAVRHLCTISLASLLICSAVTIPVQAQRDSNSAKPHFVGFQKATLDNDQTVFHLKIEGFFGFARSCRVVFKEPDRGISHVLEIISENSDGTVEFDWMIPTRAQFNAGYDVLSIKMGDVGAVVFDRQEARWVPGTAGGMIRIPSQPSSN